MAGLLDVLAGMFGGQATPPQMQPNAQPESYQGTPMPQAPQQAQQMPQQQSGGLFSGGMRDTLRNLAPAIAMIDPRNQQMGMAMMAINQNRQKLAAGQAQQNRTVQHLISQGVDPEEAAVIVSDPELMRSWFGERAKAGKPDWQITEIYDEQGRPKKVLIDKNNPQSMQDLGGSKNEQTTLMQNLSAAGLQPGTPEYQQAVLEGTKSGVNVSVGAGEKAWSTESAKLFAKRYDDISAGASNAQQMMGMYDLAEQALNSGVRTGMGAEAELTLRQLGSAMGVDTDPEKLAGGELIRAVQNRMALTMRSPDGGMGMPGALSDRDIKFLKDSQIGIDRSTEGNRKMLAAFRAMEARKIDIARLADEYIEEHGQLDPGFNRRVREWAEANPLFDENALSGNNAGGVVDFSDFFNQ
ncbi:hypothetical protein DKP76_11475 [Falsochrobactrum shanghaiense]|uniref:Uncharacterized protein n=1 Tax=Falsochrobactrum shanghaiense TaxID=2201899 RepID=A0A316J7V2_9HYPH|nr:hypothetical protein [Falsochrobactrum shanghaiense]PWL17391.1 hypothetical protein DKP76_11475 [Falsochrobactrum shanghaiense]